MLYLDSVDLCIESTPTPLTVYPHSLLNFISP